MVDRLIKVSDDFRNIRGEFKIGGIVNIGTHTSLVRLRHGKYVMLDAYTLTDNIKKQVDHITRNGADLEAIINLHPFHTVHVKKAHAQYPKAKLYGTQRHLDKFPDLPWQAERVESAEFAALYAEDFEFSVPEGVVFISSNENLHFSSVLAYHKASRTIHVDDTLTYFPLPGILGEFKKPEIRFHMTLALTLEKRAGAAEDFRRWARNLAARWQDAENLCAAHSATLLERENTSDSIADRIGKALKKEEKVLYLHEKLFGKNKTAL